ncbi:SRPBCC family protein [Fulvivirgaceae bacterium PWU4]|uniref:SRPBCC family protein n=1 Tax=Chryseosolibacter histidini TaxID=2782349 RepID=A0AAP2DQ37_9BACT|nr:SRPBCC family protein [Chryseosolibacter histidini]MBT1700456.1 SRPBCC family protein [Chryseosolibacter histidini]
MRSVDVSTEIIINRPVEAVAAFASDPDNATKWYVNIKSVAWKTPKPLVVGTQVEFMAAFLGKKLVYTYEVTEFSPNKNFVMRTANGPFPMETTYHWQKISDSQTRMVLRNRGTPSGFAKWITPIMELAMKTANRKDLKRLKDLLEKDRTN